MSFDSPPRLLSTLAICLTLVGCQSPTHQDAYFETRPAQPSEGETSLFTIRRAESPGNADLFTTGEALNVPKATASLNDTARLLAGLPALVANDAYPEVRSSPGWREHQNRLDQTWADYRTRHEIPIQSWAAREIPDLQRAGSLFYPFSGPDFLFANAFFPRAETLVLCGLETAEPLPQLSDLSGSEIESGLDGLRNALNTVMQFSFFITKDMRTDLQSTRFRGVLPVLLVFLARTGHAVESVDSIRLDAAGNAVMARADNGATGVVIRARSNQGTSKRIFFFRQDLSNDSIRPGAPFLQFVSQLGQPPVFTKSASYLMHESSFSGSRDYLLTQCRGIVQDPSGVPYSNILSSGLDLRLYGNYQGTIDIFSNANQPDLIQAYQARRHSAQPLDFGVGYLYTPGNTCLMVARRTRW